VQAQDRSGYFVRLDATPTAAVEAPSPYHDDEGVPPPRKRNRVNFRLRPLTLIGLLILGWLAWAATTPGGVNARLEGISDTVQNWVNDATTDPGLKRAANYYNARYARDGQYVKVSANELRDDPDAGFGVGVTVEWCGPHAIVLRSLTGGGTISRLLLNGADVGDVHGRQECPPDLTNPLPWKVKQ
jgi:hypothetical protein